MADENHDVIRPKLVYGAIQNMTTLFNDLLEPVVGAGAIRYEKQTQFFTFKKQEKKHLKETAGCNCPPIIRKQQLCGEGI